MADSVEWKDKLSKGDEVEWQDPNMGNHFEGEVMKIELKKDGNYLISISVNKRYAGDDGDDDVTMEIITVYPHDSETRLEKI